jgi:hypothetical protein
MNLSARIDAFEKLGFLIEASLTNMSNDKYDCADSYQVDIIKQIEKAEFENGWFIRDFINYSLGALVEMLKRSSLLEWLGVYNLDSLNQESDKKVSIVMAGNLPLVGFHDLLSVLITGHSVQVKLSQKDSVLSHMVIDLLLAIEPRFKAKIEIVEDRLSGYDAVIATGSNNTRRYFEYYFKNVPTIIRGHKNSVAVLTGNETEEQLEALVDDLFLYFGLGCRSISKLYLPSNFTVETLFPYFEKYNHILYHHHKYMNNYLYHKSIMMVNRTKFLENGFVMMSENPQIASPISVIHYQYYHTLKEVQAELEVRRDEIQCVVSNADLSIGSVEFGNAQKPRLFDYADGVDVVGFLLALKK